MRIYGKKISIDLAPLYFNYNYKGVYSRRV